MVVPLRLENNSSEIRTTSKWTSYKPLTKQSASSRLMSILKVSFANSVSSQRSVFPWSAHH